MKLEEKIEESKKLLKAAIEKFRPKIAVAWTGGKDSTVILGLIREIYGDVPIPVIFVDTTVEFKETYEFIENLRKAWNLNLIIAKNEKALRTIKIAEDKEKCCHLLKTEALSICIRESAFKALITGIRWDEQEARSGEKYISERKNPPHFRIHPILHWTERDVWDYIKSRGIPYNPLYDRGYRSIGCEPCTEPTPEGGRERDGRAQDKEKIMERLRALGYF